MKKSLIVILVLLSVLFAAVTVLNAQESAADTAPAAETVSNPAAVSAESGMDGPSDAVGTELPAAEDPSDDESDDQDEDQSEKPGGPAADKAAAEVSDEKKGMEVCIYGTQLSIEFDGEEKTVKGYRIEVTCGDLEGKEKDACEAYGKDDFRYEGEAVAKGTDPDIYYMDLDPEKFVNENEDFEDVAFVVKEDGRLEITAKAEAPAAAEDPDDDDDDDENEKPAEEKDEDPAPAETPADDNTVSSDILTVHLDPPAEGGKPVVNTTDEENTTTVDAEAPVVNTTDEEDTTTVDADEPVVNTTDEEDTTTIDVEEPVVNTTDEEDTTNVDVEGPAVNTTDEEDTTTVDAEGPAVSTTDEEDTVTVDVKEDAVAVTFEEDTATVEEVPAVTETPEEVTVTVEIAVPDVTVTFEDDTTTVETEEPVLTITSDESTVTVDGPAPLTGIAKSGINVRTDADGMSDILFTLEEDTEVKVMAVEGDWLLVLLPDGETQGWIFRTDIELIAEETEPAEGEPTENESAEETPAPAEKKVTIFTSRRVQMEIGEDIVLTSLLEGFDDCKAIKYQWECDKGEGFEAVEGADSDSYTYPATEESMGWSFRLVVFYK